MGERSPKPTRNRLFIVVVVNICWMVLLAVLLVLSQRTPSDSIRRHPGEDIEPRPGTYPLSGSVTFPPGWPDARTTLEVEDAEGNRLTRRTLVVPSGGGQVTFRATHQIPGRYLLKIEPGWWREVDHREGGTRCDFSIPLPVEGTLRVLDRETGQGIAGAVLTWCIVPPGAKRWTINTVRRSARPGEFRFRGFPGTDYFLRIEAPGHVGLDSHPGTLLEVFPGVPLQREFRLARSGSVRVEIRSGGRPASPESVHLVRPEMFNGGGWHTHSMAVKDGVASMDGLAEGAYSVEVKPGPRFELVLPVGVEVRTGETTTLTVDLEERATTGPAAAGNLRGTVTFHGGWTVSGARVSARWEGSSRTGADAEAALGMVKPGLPLLFDLGNLLSGTYWVEVHPLQWRTLVDVPTGEVPCNITVPEPAMVHCRIVSDEDGKAVRGARLIWYRPTPGLGLNTWETAVPDPKTGEYHVQVPPGIVEFRASAPGWLDSEVRSRDTAARAMSFSISSGETARREVRLRRAASIRVRLHCEGVALQEREAKATLHLVPPKEWSDADSI